MPASAADEVAPDGLVARPILLPASSDRDEGLGMLAAGLTVQSVAEALGYDRKVPLVV